MKAEAGTAGVQSGNCRHRPAAASPTGRGGDATTQRSDAGLILSHSLAAFQAVAGLGNLAEDLRVLSLNAELAAARAGSDGRAIRALTQYTRELVHRLLAMDAELAALKTDSYASAAQAMKWLGRRHVMQRADGAPASAAAHRLAAAAADRMAQVADSVASLAASVRRIDAIAGQAATIATNISIEAARIRDEAGGFAEVAGGMRRYVECLATMTGAVRHSVDTATGLAARLRRPPLAA